MAKKTKKQLRKTFTNALYCIILVGLMVLYGLILIEFVSGSVTFMNNNFNYTNPNSNIICLQEFTNVSTACGGLDIGAYTVSNITKWTGNAAGSDKSVALYDGDVSTYAQFYGIYSGSTSFIAQYEIPSGASPTGSRWEVRNGTSSDINFTIPSACWNFNDDNALLFNFTASFGNINYLYCYNGTGYQNLTNNLGSFTMYEERMWWNFSAMDKMTFNSTNKNNTRYLAVPQGVLVTRAAIDFIGDNSTISNFSVETDGTQIYNYSGNLANNFYFPDNQTYSSSIDYNVIDDLYNFSISYNELPFDYINDYLLTCTYVNNTCYVPLIFRSNMTGNIYIKNMTFSNKGIIVIDQTVPTPVYETQTNDYKMNIFVDPAIIDLGLNTALVDLTQAYGVSLFSVPLLANLYSVYYYSIEGNATTPLTTTSPKNVTNNFYFVLYGQDPNEIGQPLSYQFQWWEFPFFNQTVYNISFSICNSSYINNILNVSFIDEQNRNNAVNSTFSGTFNYFIGDGSIQKNYSFSNPTANQSNYAFCANTLAVPFNVNLDLIYGNSPNYVQRYYYLRNAALSDSGVATVVNPTMLNSSAATKFKFTVQSLTTFIPNAVVTILLQNLGTGNYDAVSKAKTDNAGNFIEYLEIDKHYRFIIQDQNGNVYDPIDKDATCIVSPCEISLSLTGNGTNVFQGYNNTYAGNVVSSLTYDNSTGLVTYTFVDTTGLSTYFRLKVEKNLFNVSSLTICDNFYYGTAGSMTCNISGQSGDLKVTTYISRSPEKIDKILAIVINEINSQWGLMAIIFSLGFIITLVFAAAVISRGNPSVILFVFGFAVTGLKLMNILSFSWIIIGTLDVALLFLITKIRT